MATAWRDTYSGNRYTSLSMELTIAAERLYPKSAPIGSAASVSSASSPSRISEISARVKPSTRRLASSRLRSESDTRAAL